LHSCGSFLRSKQRGEVVVAWLCDVFLCAVRLRCRMELEEGQST
jgi:hypothetical protein